MKKIPVIILLTVFSLRHGPSFAQSGSSARPPAPLQPQSPAQRRDSAQPRVSAQPRDSTSLAEAFHFTDSLFDRAEFTYDIAEPDISKDIQSILARFSDAVSANKEWFIDYRKKYAAGGQSLPYNERFGITPGEYLRIQQLEKVP